MSSKSKNRKVNFAAPPTKIDPPRAMEEINQEYSRVLAQAGQLQYQIFVYEEDLLRVNDLLKKLNYEAAARQAADKAAPAAPLPTEEGTSEV